VAGLVGGIAAKRNTREGAVTISPSIWIAASGHTLWNDAWVVCV
jgi:hypothetical protein